MWYDNYTKIFHIGKIMIRRSSKFGFAHRRVDASNAHYFKIGFVDIRL